MVEHQIIEKEDGILILLSGTLSIQCASEIYQIFLDAIGKYHLIQIDHKDIEEIDISYFQLMVAMYNTALATDKKVEFLNLGDSKLNELIEGLGFQSPFINSIFYNQSAGL